MQSDHDRYRCAQERSKLLTMRMVEMEARPHSSEEWQAAMNEWIEQDALLAGLWHKLNGT